MSKYVVNKTNIAYKFQNGIMLGRKGSVEVDEKQEAELLKDFFFKGLKERGAIGLTKDKPKDLSEAGRKLAAKDAEIGSLQKRIAELEAKLDQAEATGKETGTVMDTVNPELGTEPAGDVASEPVVEEPSVEEAPAAEAQEKKTSKGKK